MRKTGIFAILPGLVLAISCASPPVAMPPATAPPEDPRLGELQAQIDGLRAENKGKDEVMARLQAGNAAKDAAIAQLQAGNVEVANLQKSGAAKDAALQAGDAEMADLLKSGVAKDAAIARLTALIAGADDRVTATNARIALIQAELERSRLGIAAKDVELLALGSKTATLVSINGDLTANLALLRSGTTRTQAEYLSSIDALNKDKAILRELIVALEKERAILTVAAEKDQADLDARIAQLAQVFSPEIARGDLDIKRFRNVLVVSVRDSVLFDPDSPKLRQESLDLLGKLAEVFKNAPDRVIRVEGNTAVAVSSPEVLRLYPTSWHLGAARAANVVEYLQDACSMDPLQLVATSLGEYRPQADNSTEAGKARNRRVDFVLMAKALYEIDLLQSVSQ